MGYFTIEIGGRPIMVLVADTIEEAERFASDEGFLTDLTVYELDGVPLWDGAEEITCPVATALEQQVYEDFVLEMDEDAIEVEGAPAVFLVDASDPLEDGDGWA